MHSLATCITTVGIAVIAVLPSVGCHDVTTDYRTGVKLTASLSKTTYLKAEPVFLAIGISNQLDEPVVVWRPYLTDSTFRIVLTNDSGRVFPWYAENIKSSDGPGKLTPVGLDVGDSLSVVVDLVKEYSHDLRASVLTHKWRADLTVGRYYITVKYEFERGKLQTKPITFVVEEPPPEERGAYELLVKATDPKGNSVEYLDRIITGYPHSQYHAIAYERKMELYKFADATEEQEKGCSVATSLIQTHPLSGAACAALVYLIVHANKVITSDKERCALLQEMLANYPGSPLAGRAKELMKYSVP